MKLVAKVGRSLQADMQAQLRDIDRAAAAGTKSAGRGLKTELRQQVTTAGLGQRLARTWRDKHYDNRGRTRRAWSTPRRRSSSERSTRVL